MTHSSSSYLRRSADCPALNVLGVEVRILADSEATGGHAVLSLITCAPGAGAPPHRHAAAEHFHVISGSLGVWRTGEWQTLAAGDFVHVAPDDPHAFRNEGSEPAIFLNVGTPSGHEEFFREAHQMALAGAFSEAEAASLCRRHGIELAV